MKDRTASSLTADDVNTLASSAGLKLQDEHVKDWTVLLGSLDQSVESIMDHKDYTLSTNLDTYPRKDVHIPSNTDKGGWVTRCIVRSTIPKTGELEGRTIALKDNIALAGVLCTNGTLARNWTPDVDATIATRIMDAAGTITGKAACENACMEGVSDTSCTGSVHNPYADGYSCGGSSSGSGRLVATGSVDMAIGCDQGGSIRIPASMCGIVGLKPTWGLVPYTGILSLECTIDHAGPMTKTVRDAALLLDVIAGSDGVDDRQPAFLPSEMMGYTAKLDTFLTSQPGDKPLSGMRIGVLEEGFTIPGMEANIATLCHRAVDHLASLGAGIKRISIPWHSDAAIVWMCSHPVAGAKQGLLGDMEGRKQLFFSDRPPLERLSQTAFDALGPGAQNLYMRYLYLKQKYGPALHAKCMNLLRRINVSESLWYLCQLRLPN